MKIGLKLTFGFLIIALLVGIVGFVGFNTVNTLKEQKAVSDVSKGLLIAILGSRETLQAYLLTEDLDALDMIKGKHEGYKEKREMLVYALAYGTGSTEFKSRHVYEHWIEEGYESEGINTKFSPEVAGLAEEIADILGEVENAERDLIQSHDERLAAQARFDNAYPAEKEKRYIIMDAIYGSNYPLLLKGLGEMIYISKEALYQYEDEKHINEWLESIIMLKTEVDKKEGESTSEELRNLSVTQGEYYTIAKTMGSLTLEMKQKEADELANLASVDGYINEIDKKIATILSIVSTKARTETARATVILVIVTIAALILSIVFGIALSSSISRPIYELTKASKQVKKGNLRYKIKVKSNDEIGELSQTFDEMRIGLKDRNDLLNSLLNSFKGKFGKIAVILMRKNIQNLVRKNPRIIKIIPKEMARSITKEDAARFKEK